MNCESLAAKQRIPPLHTSSAARMIRKITHHLIARRGDDRGSSGFGTGEMTRYSASPGTNLPVVAATSDAIGAQDSPLGPQFHELGATVVKNPDAHSLQSVPA